MEVVTGIKCPFETSTEVNIISCFKVDWMTEVFVPKLESLHWYNFGFPDNHYCFILLLYIYLPNVDIFD